MFVYFRLIIPNKCSIVKRKFYAFPEKNCSLSLLWCFVSYLGNEAKHTKMTFYPRHSRADIIPQLSVKNLFFGFSELLSGEKNIFVRRREKMF